MMRIRSPCVRFYFWTYRIAECDQQPSRSCLRDQQTCLCTIIFKIRQTLPRIATASGSLSVVVLLIKLIVHSHIASG
ncbi:hypothetical protein M438DRAFT_146381 [Aureobasidium pullulans EXF-150]|uniref:Uncharacterized protein n=1 Tax=Aureobasidium pullulans EXF-150 TaxID=1043002 RepID=A0A074X247_AURPU|nr:uncharacterized protein M438DRAFT_146381 [Aureobasidium pullulans EXF-150]KEQ79550.1 hypothetical protein M438DRAFT_146381 [Aureobasidium pullulans EXF-150]